MDPIKINVNVEVGLKQTTLEALTTLLNPWRGCSCNCIEEDPQPESEKPQPEPKRKAKKAEPAPEPEAPVQDPAPAPADDDDLPPDDAPAPRKAAPAPTEADARAAVKAAKDRGVTPKAIRSFMQDSFGITSSVDCPEERRQELIDGLNRLAA